MRNLLALAFLSLCSLVVSAGEIKPNAEFIKGPLQPLNKPDTEQSVLLGHSAFQTGPKVLMRYQPIEDGGFQITGGRERFNRSITIGRNNIICSDTPTWKIHTTTGSGVYASDRSYPLFPREDAQSSKESPELGTFRLGVPDAKGKVLWLDLLKTTTATFRPGYTKYKVVDPNGAKWNAEITIAPLMDFHGFVCKIKFDKPTPLTWTCSDIFWSRKEKSSNKVMLKERHALITEEKLPNAQILCGWGAEGSAKTAKSQYGDSLVFSTTEDKSEYTIFSTWGVSDYNKELAQEMMSRLNGTTWVKEREELKKSWFDCFIGRALNPAKNFELVAKNPGAYLQKTLNYWDKRRNEFQIQTPDPYLNGLINFERAISEYHQLGPGMVLSSFRWVMYSHISVGWYGKMWSGDLEEVKKHMRLLAAMQAEDGFMNWVSPSMHAYIAENNGPYWVDHVWWLYQWTGDEKFLQDLWPHIQKAVAWENKNNDPDGDGLFRSHYEYWNCDSNGKGPKAAAPTSTAWAMHDRAAQIALVLGDSHLEQVYRAKANKIRSQALSQLWSEDKGILGSIGGNGIWRGHPQTWEQYLGINNGMLPIDKGIRAMRWLAAHYGFEPNPGINLLMNCDWWPLRWSVHWVPTGDTCLAVLAAMKCGDTDYWWPYMDTAVKSAFRSKSPAVRFGINNYGSGCGGVEFIDSDDPFMHTTVRGLFGIEPELQNKKIKITPGFPNDWKSASIKTPLLHYTYKREGKTVELRIESGQALKKQVYPYPEAKAIETDEEKVSVVRYKLTDDRFKKVAEIQHKPIMTDLQPRVEEPVLSPQEQGKLQVLELRELYNTTLKKMSSEMKFMFDTGHLQPITKWWHTPGIKMNPGPRELQAKNGVKFLVAPRDGVQNNIIALSSFHDPAPLPSGVKIAVNKKVKKLWLLLQNYVSPIKNYIPNGEVILHYTTGKPQMTSLVPPYNIDCYFQEFSREGTSVPLGELTGMRKTGHSPVPRDLAKPHATSLGIDCDPARTLKAVEIRALVTEGVIGVSGITLMPVEK